MSNYTPHAIVFLIMASVTANVMGQVPTATGGKPVPTAFPVGEGNWIAPQGTSISIDRESGRVSMALPSQPLDGSQEQELRFDEWRQHSYAGNGRFPSIREEPSSLPSHTIYRPADLASVPKLPILLWANGGCRNTSVEFTRFLGEIASGGYLVIAVGRSDTPFMIVNFNGGLGVLGKGPIAKPGVPLQIMDPKSLLRGLDWAISENARSGRPLYGHLDTSQVAAVGQSCGGYQAFGIGGDPRIKTLVALNSSFPTVAPSGFPLSNPDPSHSSETIAKPVAYFEGGPADLAYIPGQLSYRALPTKTVALMFNMPSLGHTGAYPMPDLRWARGVMAWLDWQLKDDTKAKESLVGPHCSMCTDTEIWIQSKNIE